MSAKYFLFSNIFFTIYMLPVDKTKQKKNLINYQNLRGLCRFFMTASLLPCKPVAFGKRASSKRKQDVFVKHKHVPGQRSIFL